MTDHRRPDEGAPLVPPRSLAGGQQGHDSSQSKQSAPHWSRSAQTRTQTQTKPQATAQEQSRRSGSEEESDSEKTSPMAMAAAAVAAAKEKVQFRPGTSSGTAERSERSGRSERRPSRADEQVRAASAARPGRTRRARLRLVRVDPWSVMKTSFLLSIAFGIMCVVAVFIIWSVLGAADVFGAINSSVESVVDEEFAIEDYIGMDRVLSFTMLMAVLDVVLITAVATLGAFLYNLAASLLGGLEVTLAEDDH